VRRGLYLLLPTLAIGVVAGLLSIGAHQGDAAFVFNQEHPRAVRPQQFETVIAKTREPLPGGPGQPARSARCVPGKNGPKLNPWRCAVRYGSGHTIVYNLRVDLDGSFTGADKAGVRVVNGCCVTGGTAPSG
jgi:hypothetical protein